MFFLIDFCVFFHLFIEACQFHHTFITKTEHSLQRQSLCWSLAVCDHFSAMVDNTQQAGANGKEEWVFDLDHLYTSMKPAVEKSGNEKKK